MYFITAVLVLQLQLLPWADATGKIATKFVKYKNPEGKRLDGYCCDKSSWWGGAKSDDCDTGDTCDPGFVICLGNITQSSSIEACEYGQKTTGPLSKNAIDISFEEKVGEINNPLVFEFDEWPGVVKLKILAIDADEADTYDIVDTFGYQHNQLDLVRELDTNPKTLQLSGSRSSLDLELKVFCDNNYYGRQCKKYCVPRDDEEGHFMCDPITGDRSCLPGWTGVDCLTNKDDCIGNSCFYGSTCKDGVNSYTCVCPVGRTGLKCEAEINECSSNPCRNGGTCHDASGAYYCKCPKGTSGFNCQIDASECISDPCQNNATCVDHINAYECVCQVGFNGTHCEEEIDECQMLSPCAQADNCIDLIGDYQCVCSPGFTGKNCDINIDECLSQPCQNDGLCMDGPNNFVCICKDGTSGNLCEENFDDCLPDYCLNGGTCHDEINAFSCECPLTYTGASCETKIEPCDSLPCENGGSCTNQGDNFTCDCLPGYEGLTCEEEIDECESNPCKNGGTCIDNLGEYVCVCPSDTSGLNCETVLLPTTNPTTVLSTTPELSTEELTTVETELSTLADTSESVTELPFPETSVSETINVTEGIDNATNLTTRPGGDGPIDPIDLITQGVITDSPITVEAATELPGANMTELPESDLLNTTEISTSASEQTTNLYQTISDENVTTELEGIVLSTSTDITPDNISDQTPSDTLVQSTDSITEDVVSVTDGDTENMTALPVTITDTDNVTLTPLPEVATDDNVTVSAGTDVINATDATEEDQSTTYATSEVGNMSTADISPEIVTEVEDESNTDIVTTREPQEKTTQSDLTIVTEEGSGAVSAFPDFGGSGEEESEVETLRSTTPKVFTTGEATVTPKITTLPDVPVTTGSQDLEDTTRDDGSGEVQEVSITSTVSSVTQEMLMTEDIEDIEYISLTTRASLTSQRLDMEGSGEVSSGEEPQVSEAVDTTAFTMRTTPKSSSTITAGVSDQPDFEASGEEDTTEMDLPVTSLKSTTLKASTTQSTDVEESSGDVAIGEEGFLTSTESKGLLSSTLTDEEETVINGTDRPDSLTDFNATIEIITVSTTREEDASVDMTSDSPTKSSTDDFNVTDAPSSTSVFSSTTPSDMTTSSVLITSTSPAFQGVTFDFGNIDVDVFQPELAGTTQPLLTFPDRKRPTQADVTENPTSWETTTIGQDLESVATWLYDSISTLSAWTETTTTTPKSTTVQQAGPPPPEDSKKKTTPLYVDNPTQSATTKSYPPKTRRTTRTRGDIKIESETTTPQRQVTIPQKTPSKPLITTTIRSKKTTLPPKEIKYTTKSVTRPNKGKGNNNTAVKKPTIGIPSIRMRVYHTVRNAYNVGRQTADAAYKKAKVLLRRTIRRLTDLWKMCVKGAMKVVYSPYNYARNIYLTSVNRGSRYLSNAYRYTRSRLRKFYGNARRAMSSYYNYLRDYYKKRYNYYYTQYYNYYRNLKNRWWNYFG